MDSLFSVLQDHIRNQRNSTPLASSDATGHAELAGNTATVDLQIQDGIIAASGFSAVGDPIVAGCLSFMLTHAQGRELGWATCVRTFSLAYVLRLPKGDARADLAVRAFRAALKDYRNRHRPVRDDAVSSRPCGSPRGHRRKSTLPPPTRRDLCLLRPGETYEMLVEQRTQIIGVLLNLDDCLSLAQSPPGLLSDDGGNLQEIINLTLDVRAAIPALSDGDRRLVELVGFGGQTEAEAAHAMGLAQSTIHARLRTIAWAVQKNSRDRQRTPD